jgi:hypothetical protein
MAGGLGPLQVQGIPIGRGALERAVDSLVTDGR